jgi:hypothetical protein
MVQTGYAFVLDSLLQFFLAESAVLETSLSNQTYASSSMFQSTRVPPTLGAPERSFWRWASLAPFFSAPAAGAGARLPPKGPAAVQPCRVDEGGGRVLDVVGDDCVARGSGVGHGCSLGDELADLSDEALLGRGSRPT